MDPTALNLVFALLGVVLGAVPVLAWRISDRELSASADEPSYAEAAVVPPGVSTVLNALRSSALVVDEQDRVLQASAPAYAMGLVHGAELRVPELGDLVRQVRFEETDYYADGRFVENLAARARAIVRVERPLFIKN